MPHMVDALSNRRTREITLITAAKYFVIEFQEVSHMIQGSITREPFEKHYLQGKSHHSITQLTDSIG